MSAFVVPVELIAEVVSGLYYGGQLEPAAHAATGLPAGLSVPAALALELHRMNVDAVAYRYPEDADAYRFPLRLALPEPPGPARLLKRIDCLLYQCDEGAVDRRPLYRWLAGRRDALAQRVDRKSEAYDTAPWG